MFRITVRMMSTNAKPSPSWGTLMHGMLMEHLRGSWPHLLHEDTGRPVSQWVEPLGPKELDWHVQIMDDNLAVCFLESCQKGDEWFCQHNGSRMVIEDLTVVSESLQDYIQRKMDEPGVSPMITLTFKTATTHKSQGKYVLFPSVELIANSLRNRLCETDESIALPDEHLKLLTEHTQIYQYQLQSARFGLEGSWIKGYTGTVVLKLTGPEEFIRFGNMLYGLAQWYGIGIKTTLGMGGCIVSF